MLMFKYFTASQYLKAYGIFCLIILCHSFYYYKLSLVAEILTFLAQNCSLSADLYGYAVKTGYKGEKTG